MFIIGSVSSLGAIAMAGDAAIYHGPGESRLEVTPPRNANESARYALWRGEQCAWSTAHELLARDLVLMQDLSAVGYCYPGGLVWGETLDILWISPEGAIEVLERFPRKHDPSIKANPPDPAEPTAAGVLVAGQETAVIRLCSPMHEAHPYRWLVVNTKTRERSIVSPDHPPVLARGVGEDGLPTGGTVIEVAAQYVEAADAILVHWLLFESAAGTRIRSAHFALIDLSGSTVWEHQCYDDYRQFPRGIRWTAYFGENPQVTVDGSLITVHAIRENVTRYFRILDVPDSDRKAVKPLSELPGHELPDLPLDRHESARPPS